MPGRSIISLQHLALYLSGQSPVSRTILNSTLWAFRFSTTARVYPSVVFTLTLPGAATNYGQESRRVFYYSRSSVRSRLSYKVTHAAWIPAIGLVL